MNKRRVTLDLDEDVVEGDIATLAAAVPGTRIVTRDSGSPI
jgi:hypothetical protein